MWKYIVGCLALATVVSAQDPRCTGAVIMNGAGYLPDPSRCDCWIRCEYGDNMVITSSRQCCECGFFWSQSDLTCFPARDISCAGDPCGTAGTNFYADPDNCRTYFSCDGSRTSGGLCCNPGQRFDTVSQSCIPGPACQDRCLCNPKTTLTPPTCPFRFNPLDDHTYFVNDNGVQVLMSCAPGSNYNRTACKCSTFVAVPDPPCAPDFNVVCDAFPLVDQANDAYIGNTDVAVNPAAGTCSFDGTTSNLLIPRFNNMDFRDNFAVFVAFDGQTNQNNNAPLFANSACSGPGQASIVIQLLRLLGGPPRVRATITTTAATSITVAYQVGERNNVYVSYNGEKFVLCVQPQGGIVARAEADVTGLTQRVPCAVQYGRDNTNFYSGTVYASRVYINCVPNNFCP